eukprot:SAG31_NODE_2242_length_6109_cov_18.408819_2_plen_183_part_00
MFRGHRASARREPESTAQPAATLYPRVRISIGHRRPPGSSMAAVRLLPSLPLLLLLLLALGTGPTRGAAERVAPRGGGEGCCFLAFVPTIRERRDFNREKYGTNRGSFTLQVLLLTTAQRLRTRRTRRSSCARARRSSGPCAPCTCGLGRSRGWRRFWRGWGFATRWTCSCWARPAVPSARS